MSALTSSTSPGQSPAANDASPIAAVESGLQQGFLVYLEAELGALSGRLSKAYEAALRDKFPRDATAPRSAAPVGFFMPRNLSPRTDRGNGNGVSFSREERTVLFVTRETEMSLSTDTGPDAGEPGSKESVLSSWGDDRVEPAGESLHASSAVALMSGRFVRRPVVPRVACNERAHPPDDASAWQPPLDSDAPPLPSDLCVPRSVVDLRAKDEQLLDVADRPVDFSQRSASADQATQAGLLEREHAPDHASAIRRLDAPALPGDLGDPRRVVDLRAKDEQPLAIEDEAVGLPRRAASADEVAQKRLRPSTSMDRSPDEASTAISRLSAKEVQGRCLNEMIGTQARAALRTRQPCTQDTLSTGSTWGTDPMMRSRDSLESKQSCAGRNPEARSIRRIASRGNGVADMGSSGNLEVDANTRRWCLLMRALLRYNSTYRLRECWADEAGAVMMNVSGLETETSLASIRQHDIHGMRCTSERSHGSLDSDVTDKIGNAVLQVWLEKTSRAGKHARRSFKHSERSRTQMLALIGNRKFRVPIIHPTSYRRGLWMLIAFLLVASDMFHVSMALFRAPETEVDNYIDVIACAYWSIDILLSFFTGVFINGEYVRDLRTIARSYARTWMLIDIALSATQWLVVLVGSQMDGAHALSAVRAARFIRILRCAKVGHLWTGLLKGVNSLLLATLAQASAYFLAILLWVHFSACAFYALGIQENGWATRVDVWAYYPLNYCIAFHWSAGQFQGGMDIYPTFTSAAERGFAGCHVLVCVVVLAVFVSKLTNIWQHLDQVRQRFDRLERNARQYLDDHHISMGLSGRVRKYVEWKQKCDSASQSDMSEAELMQMLPVNLRRAVLHESRTPVICQHPVFPALLTVSFNFYQQMCCDAFTSVPHLPGENVFAYGAACHHMYFIVAGTSTYVKYGILLRAMLAPGKRNKASAQMAEQFKKQRSQQLPKHTPLCEAALWTQWEHVGDFTPVTHISVLTLDIACFVNMVQTYPAVQSGLAAHASDFVHMLQNAEVSDLFTSANMFETIAASERQLSVSRQDEARPSTRFSFQGSIFARFTNRQRSSS